MQYLILIMRTNPIQINSMMIELIWFNFNVKNTNWTLKTKNNLIVYVLDLIKFDSTQKKPHK